MRVSQNSGYHFGCPYNKDYSILGSILGYLYFGKLLYRGSGKENESYYLGFRDISPNNG